jgi:hypothetical protein
MSEAYPTAWAYEQVCVALEDQRQRADQAEADVERLLDKLEEYRNTLAYFGEQAGRLLAAHEAIAMDTPEDRELHARTVATFKDVFGITERLGPRLVEGAGDDSVRLPSPAPDQG